MSARLQLRLMIVGATLGAIGGIVVLQPSGGPRPIGVAAAAGAIFLGLSFAQEWCARRRVPRLALAYASLIGRVLVTLAGALSVVLVFNLLVAPGARSVPARPNAHATVGPVPAAPAQISGPTTPASSAGPVVLLMPASPQPAVRPPAATEPTSSAPRARVVPVSSSAATSPVSPITTPRASPQSPPPSAATAPPAQSVAPATPQPTPVSSPPSIVPTLPPLATLPIRLP